MRATFAILIVALGLASLTMRIVTGSAFAREGDQARVAWTDDFLQDYVSARAWLGDTDPYEPTVVLRDRYVGDPINDGVPRGQANPHPPAGFLLVAPVTFLTYDVARAVWLILSALAVALALGAVARALGAPMRWAVVAGVGGLALPIVQKDLSFGQNNGLILLMVVGAWLSLRDGRHARAGALLGLASAVKLFPLFLIIPLLRVRAYRAVVVTVGSVIGIVLVTTAIVGMDATVTFVTDAAPSNFEYWQAGPLNLSLLAVPFRWLTENPWRDAAVDLPVLATLLALLAGALCVMGAWRTRASRSMDPFWAAVPWMILATPLAWEHYLVIAIPAAAMVLTHAMRDEGTSLLPAGLLVALVVIGTPPGVSATVPGISDLTQVLAYGLPLYGLLGLALLDLRTGMRVPSGRRSGSVGAARAR